MRGGVSRGRTALLGLDVGTTTVKALLVAPHGEPLGLHVAPYPAERASDQPEEWWEAVLRAVRGLDVASRRVDIAAVGVCGRGSGLALLDRRRDPIPAPWARVRARAGALGLPATRRFRRVAQWGRLLRALGYEVAEAPDGVAALELLRTDPRGFDLVLTDQTMPRLSGTDLARAILAERPQARIVLCSGYADALDEAQARALGLRGLLTKPVERDALAEAVRAALAPAG